MDAKELRTKSAEELKRMLTELRAKLRDLSFQVAMRRETHVRLIRLAKKEIARIETILSAMPVVTPTV